MSVVNGNIVLRRGW